ncbi:MAG TPA: ornithine carbamoyltransferase [Myxococcaceae bacterium]|nr:ornithine carbamoyltransferase [Myxococcaceae bacterium]
MIRHFLTLSDLSLEEHQRLLARAVELKARWHARNVENTLAGRTLVLVFEKASTRTRLSFEAAMYQLGGHAITLPYSESQLARGEPLSDTARVISRYSDAIMVRTFGDERLAEFTRHATVPVINGLTDGGHPVQLLADLMTVQERSGPLRGKVVAWIGDGAGNMARSWAEAARLFDFELRIAAPEGYRLPASEVEVAKGRVKVVASPDEAVKDADVVTTDVWTSMGQEAEVARRKAVFAPYRVDDKLLSRAKPTAIVLHCLPAHRGEEITEEVIDSPQSAIFDEAENRLHVQKALLEKLILG